MSVQQLPTDVVIVLQRARALERSETGHSRIEAYRLTRALLGGAREAGFSAPQLADCLGVSVSTLQGRAYSDDWVSEPVFAELSGVGVDAIRRWRRCGRLPHRSRGEDGDTCYLASDLITTMVNPPARRTTRNVAAGR
jgi:DNA-binding transcriptional regulator YiaG